MRGVFLRDEDLFDLALIKFLRQVSGVSDFALSGADLLIQGEKSVSAVDASIRENNWIVLNVALAVMSVWHVASKLVQFS